MVTTRELSPGVTALTELYRDYEWWADRELEGVRAALAGTDVAVGVRRTASRSPPPGC